MSGRPGPCHTQSSLRGAPWGSRASSVPPSPLAQPRRGWMRETRGASACLCGDWSLWALLMSHGHTHSQIYTHAHTDTSTHTNQHPRAFTPRSSHTHTCTHTHRQMPLPKQMPLSSPSIQRPMGSQGYYYLGGCCYYDRP